MQWQCRLIAASFAVLSVGTAQAAPVQFKQRLPTPGFEGQITEADRGSLGHWPEGWGVHLAFNGRLEVVSDADRRRSGAKAVRIFDVHNDPQYGWVPRMWVRRRVSVNPDYEYTFSFWTKGHGKIGWFAYEYIASGKFLPGDYNFRGQKQRPLTDQWQQHRFTYKPTTDMVGSTIVGIELIGQGAEAWVDDTALTLDLERFPPPSGTLELTGQLTAVDAQATKHVSGLGQNHEVIYCT